MKESHTNEITLKWRLKRQKLTKKKKKEKQRKEEERTVMARYEGPVVEKSSRFKSRRRVNIYFLSMVEPNRSTSCNYMKENSGMKKWKQKKKEKEERRENWEGKRMEWRKSGGTREEKNRRACEKGNDARSPFYVAALMAGSIPRMVSLLDQCPWLIVSEKSFMLRR